MSISKSRLTCECGIQRSVTISSPIGVQLSDLEKLNIAEALADEIEYLEEQGFAGKTIKWVTNLRSKFVDDEGKPK